MRDLTRRDFARGLGAAALAAPFFSLVKKAPAQTVARQAKYFLIFFTNGTDVGAWTPVGSTESRIQFSQMTAPLEPLKANLVLVEHLSSFGTADNHAAPGGLTGLGYGGQNHLSVDQFIADRLRAAGITTTIPSLILGGVSTEQQSTFFRGGQRLSPIFSPQTAYETIFAGAGAGAGGQLPPEVLRRRRSVLDIVSGELDELSSALGAEERQRLELHTDSIRQLEERLAGGGSGGSGSGSCNPPAAPADGGQPLLNSQLHLDLAVAAFACDITRVAAVEFGNHQSTQVSIPQIGDPGDWHNSFIHGDNPRTRLINLERWLCERFVETASKLKAVPSPDGNGTLFDQTLMMWARDMGDAVVHNGDLRFVFSGGAGGYLKTSPDGRYIDGRNDAHQRALVTCCHAMGINDYSGFGDPNVPRTPLETLIA